MILIIMMNLFIDFIYFIKYFELGIMICFVFLVCYVGGKGINCGWVFVLLGLLVILMGFLGGYFGGMI